MCPNRMHYKTNEKDKHRTIIIIGGNKIQHDRDIGTPTAHLETEKLLFNSVLSRRKSMFMTIDIANFYLMTPLYDYECLRIHVRDIPSEITEEHNLN